MAKRSGSESLAVDVADKLRDDIFNRRLAPGERLKPTELSARFGVSTGVVREALSLLAAQDLIRIERNRGFHVMQLSAQAFSDLTATRTIVEGAALAVSVEHGGVKWESELLAAHHRMISEPVYFSGEENVYNLDWGVAHRAFHYKLIEACGNPVLLEVCSRLSASAEVYRAWAVPHQGDAVRDVAAEHRALLDAALAHDSPLAVELLKQHFERTVADLVRAEAGVPSH